MFFRKKSAQSGVEYLVVGLGNPGLQYEKTRHNAGFYCLDFFAKEHGISIDRLKYRALTALTEIGGHRCLLLKPQTFMNRSGESVQAAAAFYKIPPERIIVVFDDISLPVGRLRIRRKGSDGGHNGIKDIILHLNSEDFPRIKIGVGEKPHPDYDLADWVLSRFTESEEKTLGSVADRCSRALETMIDGRCDQAMNQFNG